MSDSEFHNYSNFMEIINESHYEKCLECGELIDIYRTDEFFIVRCSQCHRVHIDYQEDFEDVDLNFLPPEMYWENQYENSQEP